MQKKKLYYGWIVTLAGRPDLFRLQRPAVCFCGHNRQPGPFGKGLGCRPGQFHLYAQVRPGTGPAAGGAAADEDRPPQVYFLDDHHHGDFPCPHRLGGFPDRVYFCIRRCRQLQHAVQRPAGLLYRGQQLVGPPPGGTGRLCPGAGRTGRRGVSAHHHLAVPELQLEKQPSLLWRCC